VRAAATDLNVTLALAIISVVMTQVYGFRAQGVQYLGKFVATRRLGQGNAMGLIDLIVGALEGISEFAKIISFTFRLFGNIFGEELVLAILFFLAGLYLAPLPIMFLGLFTGFVQAFIFCLLSMMYFAGAMEHAH